jgi:hypothetical protein
MSLLFTPGLCVEQLQYDAFISRMAAARSDAAEAAVARAAARAAAAAQQSASPAAAYAADGGAAPAAAEAAEEDEEPVVPDESNAVWPMLLWRGGVGFPGLEVPSATAFHGARVDVLRLILALSSQARPVAARC